MSHLIGARNNTPDLSSNTGLRPPSTRNVSGGSGHHLRASADLGAFVGSGSTSPMAPRGIRPLSEVFLNQPNQGIAVSSADDVADQAAQQWIADIDQYETTLEEMAAATLDQDFKDELSAIEQWFRVLSEPERTASLYALLQQTTQVQIRFFIQVLQQMAKSLPMSGVLSPANFGEKDAMSSRMNDAMSKLSVDNNRAASLAFSKPPLSPGMKRNSGLDPSTINSMFPDAAAAIAKQKADYKEHTGNMASSNRNGAVGDRSPLFPPSISTQQDGGLQRSDSTAQLPPSPWNARSNENLAPITRPKSSTSQRSMSQFSQPLPSAGLLSPRTRLPGDNHLHKASIDSTSTGIPILSPYHSTGNWASMVNTPMTTTFSPGGHQGPPSQVDMVANATAMKLAALSTVNNRIQLDDAKKYRRARSGGPSPSSATSAPNSGFPSNNIMMTNELGQVLTPQQAALVQAQQMAQMQSRRSSRPNSPGLPMTPGSAGGFGGAGAGGLPMSVSSPNGFLSAYDQSMLSSGMAGMSHMGLGEDYSEDASRGRSPRGRRGPAKAPDDPTDLALLTDIPAWLRALRLHKYNDNLKDMPWQSIVVLDEAGLEGKGVNALGARRKLLKVFEQVREVHGGEFPEILSDKAAGIGSATQPEGQQSSSAAAAAAAVPVPAAGAQAA